MDDNYVIAADKMWCSDMVENLSRKIPGKFILVNDKNHLTVPFLNEIKPRFLFFTHWSSIIPHEIHENYECVIFHMTDVPFGRGGSPLQNLIARGIYETQLSALKCTGEIDAGPVYLKYPLELKGKAQDIFGKASILIEDMIEKIAIERPIPVPQVGEAVYFARRKPEESNVAALSELEKLHDYIRMLDADGYPNAYIETEHFRFEFRQAQLKQGEVTAIARIIRKENV